MVVKTCTRCGEEKTLNDFYKDVRATDGHYSKCKRCFDYDRLSREMTLTAGYGG
jgi:hypothetical protein